MKNRLSLNRGAIWLLCWICVPNISAQMVVKPLPNNPALHEQSRTPRKQLNKATLPFLEDFSEPSLYPHADRWQDQQAFVNRTWALSPPSIGVATLDALDHNGQLYPQAGPFAFTADTLTSVPIRLDSIFYPEPLPLSPKDSVILSFFYQPGGGYGPNWEASRKGFAPSKHETLSLEFYNPTLKIWEKIWTVEGQELKDFCPTCVIDSIKGPKQFFKQVMIPIVSPDYFKPDFAFRFRNYAAIDPEWLSGGGQWHVDYIVLDAKRSLTDTQHVDLAFVEPLNAVLKPFQSIPANHFTALMRDTSIQLKFKNLDKVAYVGQYHYDLFGPDGQKILTEPASGNANANIFPYNEKGFNADPDLSKQTLRYTFSDLVKNHSEQIYRFEHILTLGAQADRFRSNDTIKVFQRFADEMAYDDGTPEAGIGVNYAKGMMACRFQFYERDTLSAFKIYFNHTAEDMTGAFFEICIWNSGIDSLPLGEPFFVSKRVKPTYKTPIDFQTIYLDTSLSLPKGTYFMGFRQVNDLFLNIGFDQNNSTREQLFYWDRTARQWMPSMYYGSIMFRPLLGRHIDPVPTKPQLPQSQAYLSPNPCSDHAVITSNQHFDRFEIFDRAGRIIKQSQLPLSLSHTIWINDLPQGLFLIRLYQGQQILETLKFIKH